MIYSRITEERLIEKYKKEFFSKTGKILQVMDYKPTALGFPVIGLHDLQSICEQYLPEENLDLKMKNRTPEIVYPRMIFCFIAYNMNYSIRRISEYIQRDRTTVYSAVSSIDKLLSTSYPPVTDLYFKIANKINRTYESNVPTMSDLSDIPEPAVSAALV